MSHNTWTHRMVRPAARFLVGTGVTADHISWLRLLSGLSAAVALGHGEDLWRHIGGALFLFSFLLDRADGELARHSGTTSGFGHKLDLIGDTYANALAFVGLGIGLRSGFFGPWAIGMGIIAGLAVAAVLLIVMRIERARGQRAAELRPAAGFDVDDAMLALPLFIWLGLDDLILALAALGAPMFCIGLAIYLRRRLA